jgi:TRAP-type C4-dicarboxylate transport system permease small subunit
MIMALLVKNTLQQVSDILNRATEVVLIMILSVMALVVLLQVIFRYVLNFPLFWTEEFARYCLVWSSLLGSALAVKRGQHIAVTIIMERLSPALHRLLTITALISVAVILLIILWGGMHLVAITRAQISPALRVSMSIPYLAVPVGAALMLLHTIVSIIETIAAKKADWPHIK